MHYVNLVVTGVVMVVAAFVGFVVWKFVSALWSLP